MNDEPTRPAGDSTASEATQANLYVVEEVRKTLQAWLDSPLRAVPKERVRGLLAALTETDGGGETDG